MVFNQLIHVTYLVLDVFCFPFILTTLSTILLLDRSPLWLSTYIDISFDGILILFRWTLDYG